MDKNYISGLVYKEIFRNEINGYTVALLKIKDKNIDFDNDIINITGIFPKLNEKKDIHSICLFNCFGCANYVCAIFCREGASEIAG